MWERSRSTSFRELYEAHKPLEGLKLLGHAVLGKLQSSPGGEDADCCAACAVDRHPSFGRDRRCIVQLGTNSDVVNGCMVGVAISFCLRNYVTNERLSSSGRPGTHTSTNASTIRMYFRPVIASAGKEPMALVSAYVRMGGKL
ncbi:hypothetical protein FKP32DRAFT_1298327 [Trametes sanguinea]|nr:hypothetical protein FKP32DRAFT_1298327 [Trametes sanguinea]